ncbi:gluconate permease [Lachnospiraceae bacterium]|nr:gluconate permease [Lachnospiraceae bacterium]
MSQEALTLDPTRLIIAALIGLAILLVLIIKFKIQAMVSILIGAISIGLIAGMPFDTIVTAVNDGIGNTLKGIALLVGLGSMFGAILEVSGGAQTLAVTMVKRFGDKKAAWALGITGLVIAMPVFFDAGLIILIPLAFSLAKRTNRSSLFYAIPLLAGLAVGHAYIPPTPGPILVATMLGVDLGWVIMIGIFCGVFAMIVAGPIWGSICGKKYDIPVPNHVANQADFDESKLPSFWTIVGIILIPLMLIILDSVFNTILTLNGDAAIFSLLGKPFMAFITAAAPIFAFLGEPFVALLIATVAAMLILGLGHGYNTGELEKVMTKSLEPTGLILLVTACGGVLRYMLQYSGLGDVIGNAVSSANLPIVIVAFIVAALVRICVGSATVAMTMAAGIISAMPGIADLSPLYLACTTAAVAGGATVCSHFNDSGFWLVKSLVGMDEKTTLKTWTIMETLVGGVGFLVALIISLFA